MLLRPLFRVKRRCAVMISGNRDDLRTREKPQDRLHSVCRPVGFGRSSAGPPRLARLRAVLIKPTCEKA